MTVIITACGTDAKYEKAFEAGIKALQNEETALALEKFEEAKEVDAREEVIDYIEAMTAAEEINTYVKDQAYDDAIVLYDDLFSKKPYGLVRFILADSEAIVQEAAAQQKTIDLLIEALKDYFDPEDENQLPDPFYFELLYIILDLDYLSDAQREDLEKGLEEAEKRLTEAGEVLPEIEKEKEATDKKEEDKAADSKTDSEETGKHTDQSTDKKEDTTDKSKDKNEEKPSSPKELTIDEAEAKVRDFVDFDSKSGLKLNYDHEADGKYVFQYFEVVGEGNDSHTATLGWYQVDKKTGAVSEAF